MSRYRLAFPAALACLVGAAGIAPAQTTSNPYSRPRVSPYINLLRGGSSPGVNYFGIVRPEIEARAAIGQVSQLAQQNQQAITGLQNGATGPLTTGHAVGFQNHTQYFQNLGGGGQGGGQAGFGVGLGGSSGAARAGAAGQTANRGGAGSRAPSRGR